MQERKTARRLRFAAGVVIGLAVLAIVTSSWSEEPELGEIPGHPAVPLAGRVLSDDERLAAPFALAVIGERLVALDAFAETAVHVIRRSDGRLERSIGRRGEGPGEFRSAASLAPSPGEPDVVWVYDFGLQRLTRVDLDEPFPESAREEGRLIRLEAEVPILTPAWHGDTLILSLGFFPEGRLGQFAPAGHRLATVGALPPGDEGIAPTVRQHAWQSVLRPRPDGSLLAVGARHAGRIEILRPDGDLAALAGAPFPFEPVFEVRSGEKGSFFASGPGLRYGYLDLAATRDRIYALFSGRRRNEHPRDANVGRHVHVFDWEGRLRGALELDALVIGIAVDPEGEVLYAARHDPVPAILAYPLGASP